ncbi:hypothetical protein MA16_Dca021499 [Dendrobium catenatum]|uniref:Uncharacterized protein n=1 Tax=Dendrobium catenatum TaxID=906689 RepID=A0A2I0VQC7_9ASPA|nr:hypothetical protein MA16_Dca021499 [Dendrobium catenatum]
MSVLPAVETAKLLNTSSLAAFTGKGAAKIENRRPNGDYYTSDNSGEQRFYFMASPPRFHELFEKEGHISSTDGSNGEFCTEAFLSYLDGAPVPSDQLEGFHGETMEDYMDLTELVSFFSRYHST